MNADDNPPTSDFLNGEAVDLWETDDLVLGGGGNDYGVVVALSTRRYEDTDFIGKTLSTICTMTAVVCHTGSPRPQGSISSMAGRRTWAATAPGARRAPRHRTRQALGVRRLEPLLPVGAELPVPASSQHRSRGFAPGSLQVKIQGPGLSRARGC